MTNVEQLKLFLERAVALVDGAGGGDWNRESADWQLAAAQWKQQLENELLQPERFVLEDDLTPAEAAQRAIGAASTCWENPGGAGVFDSDRASRIAKELVAWLRRHPADHTKDLVARAWQLLRRVPEGLVVPPWEQEAHQLGRDIAAQGWVQRAAPVPGQEALPLGDTQRWPAEYADQTGMAERIQAFVADDADTAVDAEVVDDPEPRRPMLPASYPAGRMGARSTSDYPTAPGVPDLGDDPDGDLDGYDGPMGTPGGYCTFRLENAEPHLPGAWEFCPVCGTRCAYNGSTPHDRGSRPGCGGCKPMPDRGFPGEQLFVDGGGR